jgi:hypothetical protein
MFPNNKFGFLAALRAYHCITSDSLGAAGTAKLQALPRTHEGNKPEAVAISN